MLSAVICFCLCLIKILKCIHHSIQFYMTFFSSGKCVLKETFLVVIDARLFSWCLEPACFLCIVERFFYLTIRFALISHSFSLCILMLLRVRDFNVKSLFTYNGIVPCL